jgi:hypothetical protein
MKLSRRDDVKFQRLSITKRTKICNWTSQIDGEITRQADQEHAGSSVELSCQETDEAGLSHIPSLAGSFVCAGDCQQLCPNRSI